MTFEIVEISSCKRNLSVEIPAEEVDQEVEKLAKEYARSIKLPGFRPGKVPLNVIRQRFGNDLLKDAKQNLIERCWKRAMEEHNLKPLSPPEVKDATSAPGSPFKFTVSFEVLPPIEVNEYKGLPVSLPPPEVTEEDVNRALDSLRENNAQFVPVEGEAQDGHYLTVSVEGQFEGAKKPMREDDVSLVLGHPQTNSSFTENLRGTRLGETRQFEVSYPADYHRKGFAGKKVFYSVLVKDIKEKQLPEPNDDFAKDMGAESLEALKNRLRDELVTQARQVAEKKARDMLLEAIVQRQTVEVPECLVNDELQSRASRVARTLAYQGVDINQASIDWNKVFEEERPRAEEAVRRALILSAIARQENIEVTEDEIDAELQKMVVGTGRAVASLKAQLEKEERIQDFVEHLRRNKALDFIYLNANITEG